MRHRATSDCRASPIPRCTRRYQVRRRREGGCQVIISALVPDTPAGKGNPRQLPVMLYFIFQLGQFFDDAFPFSALLFVCGRHIADGAMEVVNCSSLVVSIIDY